MPKDIKNLDELMKMIDEGRAALVKIQVSSPEGVTFEESEIAIAKITGPKEAVFEILDVIAGKSAGTISEKAFDSDGNDLNLLPEQLPFRVKPISDDERKLH